ncbi:MAG: P1 family peptidase [Thermodesulfobacteriota bacterium]
MTKTGLKNSITDVPGILVGLFSSVEAASGVTVVLCPKGAVGGVDVRGAAPGTRETDLLDPVNLVDKVHAVVLTGGSVYGLSVCDGVVKWLAAKGWGIALGNGHVAPIVPAAVLYDLGRGKDFVPPVRPAWGTSACESAQDGPVPLGSVGAGTGAVAGSIKGGLGSVSEVLDSGLVVGALVAVNSLGSVIDPESGLPWESRLEVGNEFGAFARQPMRLPAPVPGTPVSHTTIGLVATDATLTKAQARKIAQMAHDGLARSIRPAHTMFDGDTIFCLATGRRPLPDAEGFLGFPKAPAINELGRAAADCVARAIIRAVVEAHSPGNIPALRDLESF